MASIFTKIIAGEVPADFIWRDDVCVSFMTVAPLRPGHALVVPREEISHWVDLSPAQMQHLMGVAHHVGNAIQNTYDPMKVGMIILGLEVPHTHIHLSPIWKPTDLDFANANASATPESRATEAVKLRAALRELGQSEFVSD